MGSPTPNGVLTFQPGCGRSLPGGSSSAPTQDQAYGWPTNLSQLLWTPHRPLTQRHPQFSFLQTRLTPHLSPRQLPLTARPILICDFKANTTNQGPGAPMQFPAPLQESRVFGGRDTPHIRLKWPGAGNSQENLVLFFKLRCNSHNLELTILKCTVQCCLAHSQYCAKITPI